MSEKYYREINTNKDIVKFKFQLGAILLKLNNHSSNILNNKNNITKLDNDIKNNDKNIKDNITNINSDIEDINNNITKLDTAIKNNDKDIKNNYDICTGNNNNLIDIDRNIYAVNGNITNINNVIVNIKEKNKNIIKYNYSIENIWLYNIDILNTYTITSSKISLFEYYIEGDFVTNSVLEISCNILYKYENYSDIGLLKHVYSLIDANDNLIYSNKIIHTNSGDNYTNHIIMNDSFSILFKNSHTSKLKIKLQLSKVDTNNSKTVRLRILNPYNSNDIGIKHIKYLSEK